MVSTTKICQLTMIAIDRQYLHIVPNVEPFLNLVLVILNTSINSANLVKIPKF